MPKIIDAQIIETDTLSPERLAQAGAAAQELIELKNQASVNARSMAVAVGYSLPADCTDPDLIQRDIMMNMRRSVESCLEVGRGLLVLKNLVGHGNFVIRLDVLQIEERVARRFMQSAKKFSNRALTPVLQSAGNQTKLFEMLVLDDEELEELALTGQTGELVLDDVATMSVKELRAKLREAKLEQAANEKLLQDKNTKLDKLTRDAKKGVAAITNWPVAFEPLYEQTDKAYRQIETSFSDISNIIAAALAVEIEAGEEISRDLAFQGLANKLNDLIGMSESVLAREKKKFSKTLDSWTPVA